MPTGMISSIACPMSSPVFHGLALSSLMHPRWPFFPTHGRRRLLIMVIGVMLTAVMSAAANAAPAAVADEYFPELGELVARMSATSPRILAARATLEAAAADRSARASGRLPRVDLEANLAHREEFRDQFPKRQSTTIPVGFAAIRQPLYHWGAIDAERDIGVINEAIQQERYEDASRLVINRARRIYLELQVTRAQLQHETQSLKAHADIRNRERERLRLGEITVDQAENAELDYEEARLREARVSYHMLNLEAELRRISGWQEPWRDEDHDLAQKLAMISQGQKALLPADPDTGIPPPSTDYRIIQQQIQREGHHYTIIQARTRPLVNLVGNVIQDQIDSVGATDANRTLLQIMLQVRWNVFDGFDSRYRKMESLARRRSLRHEAEIQRSRDLDETKQLMREHALQQRELDLMELRGNLRQRELQRAQANFRDGEIPAAELERIRRAAGDQSINMAYAQVRMIDLQQRLADIFHPAGQSYGGIKVVNPFE